MSGAALGARTPRWRALGAAATLVAGLGLSVAIAPAASADDPVLAPGATASSSNIMLLANIPKSGAFATEAAFNSDLAFSGKHAFAGNYNGFTVYDISTPAAPEQVVQLVCPGSQNDITVHRNLLFLSVDSIRSDDSCNSTQLSTLPGGPLRNADGSARAGAPDYWEGIRIFDISNPAAPEYVKSVETDCGSHTHTLVPTESGKDVFVYVSSYSPQTYLKDCQPPHDKISIVKVPVSSPASAAIVAEPVLFPDGGLVARTQGCHDITAYPAKGIAAGACMGEGVIMDISNPASPVVQERVADTVNFDFWHSATFNNDADTVIFTDELGGGGAPTCNHTVGPNKGANALYTMDGDRQLSFASYYKIARSQSNFENCVAHNGSLIPVKGKDIMVQAWYQGGISVFDFTDPTQPTELGWFDRGALSAERLVLGGSWSAYYHDGYIYSNDIQKGFDVLEISDPRVADIKNGKNGRDSEDFNPQTQPKY